MNLAIASVSALALAVAVSFTSRMNVGALAIALAWIVGVLMGGLSFADIALGFPSELFLMLIGVTMLFTSAQANGTLDRLTHYAVRLCRGNAGLVPVMFFLLALLLASIGPGNIAIAALLAPIAMQVAGRASIPAFLMTIMVGNGAQAGSLSPVAPTGIIVNGLLAKIGFSGLEWPIYLNTLLAHSVIAFAGYFAFGGWKLFALGYSGGATPSERQFEFRHWITLAVIVALILSVIFYRVNVGMAALTGVVILSLTGAAREDAIKLMPWGTILMVSGVTVLIALVEKTQGMELFSALLARISTSGTVTATVSFVTGIVSVYSSTSGVVLPAFIPTIPGLASRIGADPLGIIYSMCVGSHLVDISPLSTVGALCIAAAAPTEDHRRLFNLLLAWGLSMSVVGALASWLFFGLLR